MSDPLPRYEKSDANTRGAWIFGMALSGSVVLVVFGIGAMLQFLSSHPASPTQASWVSSPATEAPAPRLQTNPRLEMEDYRAGQDALLAGYGWVDRKRSLVRIPIDRAMDLLVEKGVSPTKTWPNGATRLEMQQQKAGVPTP
ncbi:MAG TPA: hypothetical protein VIT21_12520 [Chthoniobacterales bacterium]